MTREELEVFMQKVAEKVSKWPVWKKQIRIMDRYRQYDRYEPEVIEDGSAQKCKR